MKPGPRMITSILRANAQELRRAARLSLYSMWACWMAAAVIGIGTVILWDGLLWDGRLCSLSCVGLFVAYGDVERGAIGQLLALAASTEQLLSRE